MVDIVVAVLFKGRLENVLLQQIHGALIKVRMLFHVVPPKKDNTETYLW